MSSTPSIVVTFHPTTPTAAPMAPTPYYKTPLVDDSDDAVLPYTTTAHDLTVLYLATGAVFWDVTCLAFFTPIDLFAPLELVNTLVLLLLLVFTTIGVIFGARSVVHARDGNGWVERTLVWLCTFFHVLVQGSVCALLSQGAHPTAVVLTVLAFFLYCFRHRTRECGQVYLMDTEKSGYMV